MAFLLAESQEHHMGWDSDCMKELCKLHLRQTRRQENPLVCESTHEGRTLIRLTSPSAPPFITYSGYSILMWVLWGHKLYWNNSGQHCRTSSEVFWPLNGDMRRPGLLAFHSWCYALMCKHIFFLFQIFFMGMSVLSECYVCTWWL